MLQYLGLLFVEYKSTLTLCTLCIETALQIINAGIKSYELTSRLGRLILEIHSTCTHFKKWQNEASAIMDGEVARRKGASRAADPGGRVKGATKWSAKWMF